MKVREFKRQEYLAVFRKKGLFFKSVSHIICAESKIEAHRIAQKMLGANDTWEIYKIIVNF